MFLDKVVIGNTIESLFYALKTDSYIVYNRKKPHLFYRELPFSILGESREPKAISRLLLSMSLLGKVIQFEGIESIRMSDHSLKIYANNQVYDYQYELCEVFDSTGVTHERDILQPNQPMYHVIDDFELRNIGRSVKNVPSMYQGEQFVSSMHFYTSDRVDGANFITDCVTDSYLTTSQLQDFEYSDSIIKFVVERYLRSVGVNGTVAGINKNGTTKFRRPVVKHVKRLVFEEDRNIYKDSESVRFVNKTLLEIVNE